MVATYEGERYPRYGYLMLHALLQSEGLVINRKRTYRVYSELGMQVRSKRRKKLVRPRVPMAVPTQVNERCSLDFVHDQLADGRRIRIRNIVDDFSRKCVRQLVDTSNWWIRRSLACGWFVISTSSPSYDHGQSQSQSQSQSPLSWTTAPN